MNETEGLRAELERRTELASCLIRVGFAHTCESDQGYCCDACDAWEVWDAVVSGEWEEGTIQKVARLEKEGEMTLNNPFRSVSASAEIDKWQQVGREVAAKIIDPDAGRSWVGIYSTIDRLLSHTDAS